MAKYNVMIFREVAITVQSLITVTAESPEDAERQAREFAFEDDTVRYHNDDPSYDVYEGVKTGDFLEQEASEIDCESPIKVG